MASADHQEQRRRPPGFTSRQKTMSSIARIGALCRSITQRYEDAIIKDPSVASKVETLLKALSYILPWRLGSSQEVFEFGCSVTSLVTLLNDYIISKRCPASSLISKFPVSQQRLLWLLTAIENMEVVSEVMSHMMWREVGKWIAILLLQLLKAIVRLTLLLKFRSRITTSPAVPAVDRKKAQAVPLDVIPPADGKSVAYKGPRTGKIIRTLHGDPAIPYSQLQHFTSSPGENGHLNTAGSSSNNGRKRLIAQEILAETLHIARPLVHIATMTIFKQSSWKPWIVALVMDILSLHLHGGLVQFKTSEPAEMLRRRLVLLLYLLRSPFYDKCSESVIVGVLRFCGNKLPLCHWIAEPLLEYLPVWQQIYSYNWMT